VITCPETGKPAAVEVDARHAAATAALGKPRLRLRDCSRWPERQGCGQECLAQIEMAPKGCLLRTTVTEWYHGKTCILCSKPIGEINWLDQSPGLMGPEGQTFQWNEIPPETVPEVLRTHRPVCWNCHIIETFRHRHPELVVDRPWKH
jgi:hypothetical protein